MKVLSESYPINTNMTGFVYFSKSMCRYAWVKSSLSIGRADSSYSSYLFKVLRHSVKFFENLHEMLFGHPNPQKSPFSRPPKNDEEFCKMSISSIFNWTLPKHHGHNFSQQGIWVLFGHPNPQKSPFSRPPKNDEEFCKMSISSIFNFFSLLSNSHGIVHGYYALFH